LRYCGEIKSSSSFLIFSSGISLVYFLFVFPPSIALFWIRPSRAASK